jgi:solute carrier family 10 (sodium/bile acid cotransporter), member 7
MRRFFAKHWFICVLPLVLGLTLFAPGVAHPVTDYWEPRFTIFTIAISLFLIAWTIPRRSLVAEVRHPWASLWAVVLSYGLVPAGAWLLGFFAPDDVRMGLILISCVPCTLSSAILWTRMAGGNEATALLTVTGTTFASWLLTTGLLYGLAGTSVPLDALDMMRDLILSLIVPVVVGQALRAVPACARFADRWKMVLSVLSLCCVLAIIVKAGVSVGDKLHEENAWEGPTIFLWSIVLPVALHLFAVAAGLVSCRWLGFDRGRQIAVAFSASQKTLQISLVLFEQYFKADYPFAVMPLLFYHVGQLLLDTIIAKRLAKGQRGEAQQEEEIYHFHI